jgi:transposase
MSQPVNKSAPSTPGAKTKPARKRAKTSILSIAYPDACGIDIGATSHFVAVPSDRDDEPVREFPAFTADLERLVQWLRRCRVTAVAMESTGVYWIPLFEMLDAAGFEVHLVNARHVRSVPGRKSDVLDCQWLQQLMSYGLLRGGFRPAEDVCALRAVWRHRDMLLAKLRGRRIKADEAEVAAALQGNWREEHLFALKQALALIDAYAAQITECDGKLQHLLGALKGHELPEAGLGAPKRGTPAKNSVRFDARTSLFEASGVDLTRIPGIDTSTALKVISEIGVDLARFPTVKHFTSWLGLCPGTKISGGKVLSSATKPCANRAAQALRMAAQALRKSQTALGAHHRRLCSRMDKPKAITASAHKLARLVYFMLTKGQAFVEAGQDEYEERYRQRVVQNLTRRAHQLGFQLTPQETSSA